MYAREKQVLSNLSMEVISLSPVTPVSSLLNMNVKCDFFTLERDEQKVLCVKIFFLVEKIVFDLIEQL